MIICTIIATILAIAAALALWITHVRGNRTRKQLEDKLLKTEQQLDSQWQQLVHERDRLLNALSNAFLLIDANGRIQFANTAAHAMFHARDLLQRPLREAFIDPRVTQVINQCLETGKAIQTQVILPQQSSPLQTENRGNTAWVIDAARMPAQDDGETLTRVIIRDVTLEHQTEQIRKDFVANASHELRTPMAIIQGYLENLLEDNMLEDTATAHRFLTVMSKHSERISRIIEDMLMISRLESGETSQLSLTDFNLKSCITDIIERLESLIAAQQATVEINMADDSLTLHGDRFYWTQTLFNLVENALKQNPHPGLRVEIGCEQNAENLRIWVSDDGIGIPSADLPHIFRRFYRVDKQHSQREIKGTGLGLSIVKRAIEAHGGTITATSSPGHETKFLITVPKTGPSTGNLP